MNFAAGLKSFMGYLEGTQKSENTRKNYRLDLLAFEGYLRNRTPGLSASQSPDLGNLNIKDVELFHQMMRTDGLKANTRRRKLITVRRFLVYLAGRNKIPEALDRQIPTPPKIERVPFTLKIDDLMVAIRALPHETEIEARNRVLLWVLAESGCQVSEVTRIRYDQWHTEGSKVVLEILGKGARKLHVSQDLYNAVLDLKKKTRKDDPWLFLGFNKFGSMGSPITDRGVELLVKQYAPRLVGDRAGLKMTPKTFRQSAVIKWFSEGYTQDQIKDFLGLKTPYAFRAYEPLLKR